MDIIKKSGLTGFYKSDLHFQYSQKMGSRPSTIGYLLGHESKSIGNHPLLYEPHPSHSKGESVGFSFALTVSTSFSFSNKN